MKRNMVFLGVIVLMLLLPGCDQSPSATEDAVNLSNDSSTAKGEKESEMDYLQSYETVQLVTDLGLLSDSEKKMIPILIEAAKIMDEIFWQQAYGDKAILLNEIEEGTLRKFTRFNYGPWDRLNNNEPFIVDAGPKSKGANYYPPDMTKQEFENAKLEDKKSSYTMIQWDRNFNLISIPYHAVFSHELEQASQLLRDAAELAEDEGLKKYLNLRAEALVTDDFKASDIAWLDMKDNMIDVIIGPIETYEDQLYGYKAGYESYILVKDRAWSKKLEKYVALLPKLQQSLPVDNKYKKEKPGMDSDLNAYDVIYYAGACNAGSKTIAINLPNDEDIQRNKGTRRLQLKNTMRAKFAKILVPIGRELIAEDQQKHITFDAFFGNVMFHEVAHGLGIKNTINGKGKVRDALKDQASSLEEGKADILGLYMITKLHSWGDIDQGSIEDYYVTFLASILRSIRFGSSSAHGRANTLSFNYFEKQGAFTRDPETQKYRVNVGKMHAAVSSLSALILKLQGDGDYEGVEKLMEERGRMSLSLQTDMAKLVEAGVPIDIIFEQGLDVLGLPNTSKQETSEAN